MTDPDWFVERALATGRCRVARFVGRRIQHLRDAQGNVQVFSSYDAAKAAAAAANARGAK